VKPPILDIRNETAEAGMDERLRQWHPDREEVARIVAELRPLIRQLALRDQEAIAAEVARRRKHHRTVAGAA
jgi:hypothetical protein